MISEPLVHSAQTMHLSCIKISTISNKLNQTSTWASSPRSTIRCVQNNFWAYGIFSTNHAPILNRHQHYLQMGQNDIPQDPCHLLVLSDASKMISKPVLRSAQTVRLSCVKISNISNELNQACTWASSPRSIIGCIQNNFWSYGMFSTNRAPILHRHQHYLQMDQNEIPHNPRHLGVPSSASKMIYELWYVWHKPCTYLASRLAITLNGLNQASTWALSPRSTIGCI
jgi:hypothetical protein